MRDALTEESRRMNPSRIDRPKKIISARRKRPAASNLEPPAPLLRVRNCLQKGRTMASCMQLLPPLKKHRMQSVKQRQKLLTVQYTQHPAEITRSKAGTTSGFHSGNRAPFGVTSVAFYCIFGHAEENNNGWIKRRFFRDVHNMPPKEFVGSAHTTFSKKRRTKPQKDERVPLRKPRAVRC